MQLYVGPSILSQEKHQTKLVGGLQCPLYIKGSPKNFLIYVEGTLLCNFFLPCMGKETTIWDIKFAIFKAQSDYQALL